MLGEVVDPDPQEVIVHKPTRPKLPSKPFALRGVGVDAEPVRLDHFHTYNYTRIFVRLQGFLAQRPPFIHPLALRPFAKHALAVSYTLGTPEGRRTPLRCRARGVGWFSGSFL